MCATISTNDGKQYQTPGFGTQAGAVIVGSMAGSMIKSPSQPLSVSLLKGMKSLNRDNDVVELRGAVNKALEMSGVKAKGVELIEVKSTGSKFKFPFSLKFPMDKGGAVAEKTAEGVSDVAIKDYKLKKAILTELPAWFRKTAPGKLYYSIIADTMKNGNNACYLPKANKCVVNLEKLGTSAFHEIGHSINRNQSKIWSVVQKMRTPALLLGATFPLIGLFKRKKVEGEESKNIVDKTTTFIKDNCGKLTTLAFVPVVAEELMATRRGNKLAKQLLNPAMYKKVVKSNALGATSYAAVAVLSGLGAYAGSKIKDMLSKPKEVKQKV